MAVIECNNVGIAECHDVLVGRIVSVFSSIVCRISSTSFRGENWMGNTCFTPLCMKRCTGMQGDPSYQTTALVHYMFLWGAYDTSP